MSHQPPISQELLREFEKARVWVTGSRREEGTKLVTAGHILNPPFTVAYRVSPKHIELTIGGTNDRVTIPCNRVVVSPYRRGQLGLYLINDEGVAVEKRVIASLSRSYQQILDSFPPGTTFSSETLYQRILTQSGDSQRHARRRWKELKYDYGFDVDYGEDANEERNLYSRGASTVPIQDPLIRPDDNRLRRDFGPQLVRLSREENRDTLAHCNYCGARVVLRGESIGAAEFDDIGLLDHRRPIPQGGGDEVTNLQILCQTCNNKKNTICRNCPYSFKCDTCIWAYPETIRSRRMVLILEEKDIHALREKFGANIEAEVQKLIKRLLD